LQQALVNLAMNGIDAMRDCDHGKRKLSISTALVGDSSIEVSVADTGTGVPPDKLNTIFDTFYTTKGHGTGRVDDYTHDCPNIWRKSLG
jgi:signal transduction histidine kinase